MNNNIVQYGLFKLTVPKALIHFLTKNEQGISKWLKNCMERQLLQFYNLMDNGLKLLRYSTYIYKPCGSVGKCGLVLVYKYDIHLCLSLRIVVGRLHWRRLKVNFL